MTMNYKLERMWKWSWLIVRYHPNICPEGMSKPIQICSSAYMSDNWYRRTKPWPT